MLCYRVVCQMGEQLAASLDGLDLILIEQLEMDGRQTIASLAERVHLGWSTVANRVRRLEEGGVIRFLTVVDPLVLGKSMLVIVGVNTLPRQIDAVAQRLADLSEVIHVSIYTGRYDVKASLLLSSITDLWGFVDYRLASIEDITRAETIVSLGVAKLSLSLVANTNIPVIDGKVPQRGLDDLDFRLMRALVASPRGTDSSLAASAGCSKVTARRRIERLTQDRLVQVICMANPVRLGYTIKADIGLGVRPGMIDRASTALCQYPDVRHLFVVTGYFNLWLTAYFKSRLELSRFVQEYLGTVPGVLHHEVMIQMKLVKDNLGVDFGSPAD